MARKPVPPTEASFVSPGGFLAYEHLLAVPAAVELHKTIGRDRIAARIRELNGNFREAASKISGLALHTPRDPELSAGLSCFEIAGSTADEVMHGSSRRRSEPAAHRTGSYACRLGKRRRRSNGCAVRGNSEQVRSGVNCTIKRWLFESGWFARRISSTSFGVPGGRRSGRNLPRPSRRSSVYRARRSDASASVSRAGSMWWQNQTGRPLVRVVAEGGSSTIQQSCAPRSTASAISFAARTGALTPRTTEWLPTKGGRMAASASTRSERSAARPGLAARRAERRRPRRHGRLSAPSFWTTRVDEIASTTPQRRAVVVLMESMRPSADPSRSHAPDRQRRGRGAIAETRQSREAQGSTAYVASA
jgi:hypothetical protein